MIEYRPKALSFSSATEYKQCPRRWRHHYVDKRVLLTPSVPALVGSFVHIVLEFLYKLPAKERTAQNARQIATEQFEAFQKESSDFQLWDPSAEEIAWFKQKCWPSIISIWDVEDPTTIDVVETEMLIETTVGKMPFKGVVDRIDRMGEDLMVTDYKSGAAPIKRYMAPKLAQVVLYAAVVKELLGKAPKSARLVFLQDSVVTTNPTTAAMNREVKEMEKIWDKIHWSLETEIFPTEPGPLCGWCPHVDICPDGQREVKVRLDGGKLKPSAPAREILQLGGFIPAQ